MSSSLQYRMLKQSTCTSFIYLFGFYVAFNTVQVKPRPVVGRAEEICIHSWSKFCTVKCRQMASNYQLSHLRWGQEPNPGLRGGRGECYYSAAVAPLYRKCENKFQVDLRKILTFLPKYFCLSLWKLKFAKV